MKPRKEKGLTAREEAFCYEYTKDLCGAHAAARAGYGESARNQACLLLKKDRIKKLIDELMEERRKQCKMTAAEVLEEVVKVARSDINDYASIQDFTHTRYEGKGKKRKAIKETIQKVVFRPWRTLDTRPIESVKQTENGISIKVHDKMKALDFLGRYLKLIGLDPEQGEEALSVLADIVRFTKSPESKLNQGAAPGPLPADPAGATSAPGPAQG